MCIINIKIEQKYIYFFSKTQSFSSNSKNFRNSFFFKSLNFFQKIVDFSKWHIPSTAYFINEIAFFTMEVGSLVIIYFQKIIISWKSTERISVKCELHLTRLRIRQISFWVGPYLLSKKEIFLIFYWRIWWEIYIV